MLPPWEVQKTKTTRARKTSVPAAAVCSPTEKKHYTANKSTGDAIDSVAPRTSQLFINHYRRGHEVTPPPLNSTASFCTKTKGQCRSISVCPPHHKPHKRETRPGHRSNSDPASDPPRCARNLKSTRLEPSWKNRSVRSLAQDAWNKTKTFSGVGVELISKLLLCKHDACETSIARVLFYRAYINQFFIRVVVYKI